MLVGLVDDRLGSVLVVPEAGLGRLLVQLRKLGLPALDVKDNLAFRSNRCGVLRGVLSALPT